jgi:anaerobic selenocysteine-containing dehydrogenase
MLLTPVGRLRIHSQYANLLQEVPMLEINLEDAKKLRISDAEQVIIKNNRGSLEVVCKITDKVPPGVVRLEHGFWADVEKPNVNDLVEPTLQEYGGGSQIMWTFVNIEKGE